MLTLVNTGSCYVSGVMLCLLSAVSHDSVCHRLRVFWNGVVGRYTDVYMHMEWLEKRKLILFVHKTTLTINYDRNKYVLPQYVAPTASNLL